MGWLVFAVASASASIEISPWQPLYKGIEHAVGTNQADALIPRLQVAYCMRVDLADPDVQLFPTPPAPDYAAEVRETLSLTVSNFLKQHRLKVAIDCNFYRGNPGLSDPTSEGVPCEVYGLQICTGAVVSATTVADARTEARHASLLFTSDKQAMFAFDNRAPGTNTAGIHTAVTGYYPVVSNGVNVGAAAAVNYPDPYVHQPQPRTLVGVSQDRRYLLLVTIDGRKPGYSEGATDVEAARWMLQFGAWNAINMDGGGSTSMCRADDCGNPIAVNRSSYPNANLGRDRERYVGSHLGIDAKPLPTFIYDVNVAPGSDTAFVSWATLAEATSQVEFGPTAAYGGESPIDPTLATNHSVLLTGLSPGRRYYFRLKSSAGGQDYSVDYCAPFYTTNLHRGAGQIFDLTNVWKYSYANLDATPEWKLPGFDDESWPSGPGLLWADSRIPSDWPVLAGPRSTRMPNNPAASPVYPYVTYYFRTAFLFTNDPAGAVLILSNYLDDGAVFYLNGVEIGRLLLPGSPAPILNSTTATNYWCRDSGDATCPYVFSISNALSANLVVGTNLLAVEVHNYRTTGPDVTFGAGLFYTLSPPPPPPPLIANLVAWPDETEIRVSWTTRSLATGRVEYGPTPSLGLSTPQEDTPRTEHSATLTNLPRLSPCFFRVISIAGANQHSATGSVSTVPFYREAVALTNTWRFSYANLDEEHWRSPDYDDRLWEEGAALLLLESTASANPDVQPKCTPLPRNPFTVQPFPTYYFRTHFLLTNPLPGCALVFSNFIDDGAVFYLNGVEIQRLRMPPDPAGIENSTLATAQPPTDDAVAADVFRFWGAQLTNLVAGTNCLAVEVHNVGPASPDVTFGSAVGLVRALASETSLRIGFSGDFLQIDWDGEYLTLQQSDDPGRPDSWSDLPGPVQSSPYTLAHPPGTRFYRLRQ